ncbi:MAG: guanylate kinase [Deltaproteobacteria bacterium]|jgi:guanylate kinase|nr:guanylate kinase [Myxococcales bacterium]MDP3217909.1 guanylate kinase [Deltaproteobacteria bacterium]
MDGFLHLIVTSPSGAGKTTMVRALLEAFPQLVQSVSNTTRAPRPGEVDGRDYHFVEHARFDEMVAEGDLCEWAEVHGHRYGTSMSRVRLARETHRGVVFVIDVQGARQVKAAIPDAVAVFVLPPSWEVLEQRLRGRGTEREEVIQRRLKNARDEVAMYGLFDYLIINDDLATAIEELKGVARATVAQRARRAQRAEALLRSG